MSWKPLLSAILVFGCLSAGAGAQNINTLYTFSGGYDGGAVDGALTLSGSVLYGTTEMGGAYSQGDVFSIPVTGGSVTVLSSLSGAPSGFTLGLAGVTLVGSTLYGTTYGGGADYDGSVFSVPVTGGPETTLLSFTGTGGACPGVGPIGSLTLVGSTFYGMTRDGGAYGDGNVFCVNINGSGYKNLLNFNGTNGQNPYGGLTLGGSSFYGLTYSGGTDGAGSVFSMPVGGGSATTLYSFQWYDAPCYPKGNLVLSGTTLYGTTWNGGACGFGTVFSMPVSGGTPTVLLNFNGANGEYPPGYLTLVGSTLYGVAQMGGAANNGTVFSVSINGGSSGIISLSASNGYFPQGGLTLSGSTWYGTASGGINGAGTVFSLPLFSPASTWNVDAGSNWSAVANWGNGTPAGMDAQATFGNAITAPRSIAVDMAVTLGTLTFNSSQSYTIAGPQAVTLQASAGDAAINVSGSHQISAPLVLASATDVTVNNSTDTLTVRGSISGPGTLNMNGAGTLVLGGANTYSGGTSVSGGTLQLAHPLAVQNSTVSMTSSGCLAFAPGVTNPVLGGLAGAANIALATAASEAVTLQVGGNGQDTIYSGALRGPGGLIKEGTGTLTLAASGTYTGPTVIAGGVLQLSNAINGSSFGVHFVGNGGAVSGSAGVVPMGNWNNESGYAFSASPLTNNSGQASGATFSLNGATSVWCTGSANQLLNGYVNVSGGSMAFTVSGIPYARYSIYAYVGDFNFGTKEEATVNGATYYFATEGRAPTTYTAITSTNSSSYQLGNYIEVDGLTGASQAVTVGGTAQQYGGLCGVEIVNTSPVSGVNVLPATTALSLASGGTLDLGGGSQQVASLSDQTPGSGGSIINSGTSASVLTISATGDSTTFSGTIRGGGTFRAIRLVMSGSGAQTLAGSNSYTGGTTINSGTLEAAGTASLPGYATAGKLTVASGGMFAVGAGGSGWTPTNIASLLAANGGNFASGSFLGIDTTAGNFSYGSAIPGSLGLTKLGANTLTLTGSNSYVGPTSVNQGNLLVNGSLASPVTVNSGGMLGGSGSLTSVTVASDGSLSPGAVPSPLNVSGSLTLVSGAQMDYALDTPADSDEVYMPSGPLVLSGQQFADFNFTWSANVAPGTYNLIDAQSITGSLGTSTSGTIDGWPANIAIQGDEVVLNVVPEPGTLMLLGAIVASCIVVRRRRIFRISSANRQSRSPFPASVTTVGCILASCYFTPSVACGASMIGFDNLGPTNTYSNQGMAIGNTGFPNTWGVATSFVPSATGVLEELWTSMYAGNPSKPLTLSLAADQSGAPGQVLWTDTIVNQLGIAGSVLHLSALNGPPLKAGSTYWLEAAAGTTYSEFWGFNLTGDTGAIAQSINGGAWNVSYHSRLGMRVGVVPSLWNVARGGSWATAANWTPAALPDGSGNTADFSWQTLAASATVTLDGSHTIGNLIFGDQGNAYNWTLAAGNGGTLTLQVSTGTPTITVDNQTATISAVLAGSQGLTTTGSGILALSGSNTYTGPTTISQGKLTVDGWLTNSAVNVSGGTLGGTGTFGSVSVNAGGHLAPGDLNSGALILAGNMDFEGGEFDVIGTGSSITGMSITGNLSLNGDPTLDVTGNLSGGPYTIASYGGTLSGHFGTLDIPTGYTINYGTGSDSSITLSAVPEPCTVVLLSAGATGLVGYGLRKRRVARRTAKPVVFKQDAPAILSFPSHSSTTREARRAA